jgi:hypothetical protein
MLVALDRGVKFVLVLGQTRIPDSVPGPYDPIHTARVKRVFIPQNPNLNPERHNIVAGELERCLLQHTDVRRRSELGQHLRRLTAVSCFSTSRVAGTIENQRTFIRRADPSGHGT